MSGTEAREHVLGLKVMRLSKPTVFSQTPTWCDEKDLLKDVVHDRHQNEMSYLPGLQSVTLGNTLILPQSFGVIHFGEIFTGYISLHNEGQEEVNNISIRIDLQFTQQKVSLFETTQKPIKLSPGASFDHVLRHEIREIGIHVLICTISYNTLGEEKTFTKYFKFQVFKPLDVKTKFYNAESCNEVYVEAQVTNNTNGPICLERVTMEPSHLYDAIQLNDLPEIENGSGYTIFGKVNFMNPGDTRLYLYCLKPTSSEDKLNEVIQEVTPLGKIDMVWRSIMGERGRLQTSPLTKMVPKYGDIRFVLEDIPSTAELNEPVSFCCKVSNCCDRNLDLIVYLDCFGNKSFVWNGVSGNKLGILEPGSSKKIPFEIIPLKTGLLVLSGLKFYESQSKKTYEHQKLAQIFIMKNGSHDNQLIE